jgi:pimeloyl-ACP methyl ester carboxylesterase
MQDFSDVYLNMLREWGFAGPGEVDIDQMQKATPEHIEHWRSLHSPQGAEYWRELLTGISTMWLTPLNYTAEDFRKISATMLILIGDRDQFISVEDAVAMYRLIPNAELAVVPNSDHSMPRTKVDMFADTVLEFLKRHNN